MEFKFFVSYFSLLIFSFFLSSFGNLWQISMTRPKTNASGPSGFKLSQERPQKTIPHCNSCTKNSHSSIFSCRTTSTFFKNSLPEFQILTRSRRWRKNLILKKLNLNCTTSPFCSTMSAPLPSLVSETPS